jgi:osmotically-inducible protein OsmY
MTHADIHKLIDLTATHFPGVEGERRLIMVRTDEQIKADLVNRLRWDSRVDASDVLVEVKKGVTALIGSVPTYRAKLAASEEALYTRGVTRVDNHIKVVYVQTPGVASGTTLKAQAESVLAWSADMHGTKIEVSVDDGMVTLKGTVPHYWQKDKAEDLVSDLQGVLVVKNELSVVPTGKIDDEQIARDVTEELERSLVDPDSINVAVADGVVTFDGTVVGYVEQQRAYNTAARTLGVRNTVNRIKVLLK